MPKELAHWRIADLAAGLLKPGIPRESIQAFPSAYYIGAVAYDSPYYAVGMPGKDLIDKTADELHGTGGVDTLARYRRVSPGIDRTTPNAKLAFLAGALTHYAADTTIHPMVGFFCNDSPLRSRRHRALETCMDVYLTVADAVPDAVKSGMRGLLTDLGERLETELAPLLVTWFREDEAIEAATCAGMIRRHAALRDRFSNGALRALTGVLGKIGGETLRVLAATFYPSPRAQQRMAGTVTNFFGEPISFRHPRTGAAIEATLPELMQRAAEKASGLITEFGATADPSGVFRAPGISLDAGCDTREFPKESHHGFADLLASTGFYYE